MGVSVGRRSALQARDFPVHPLDVSAEIAIDAPGVVEHEGRPLVVRHPAVGVAGLRLAECLGRTVLAEILHFVLQRQEGPALVRKAAQLLHDVVGGAGDFGMAFGTLLAAGGDQLAPVRRVAHDELPLLPHLRAQSAQESLLLQFVGDAL